MDPVLIEIPMPIRTPRLLLRPKQAGDGAITAAAVLETWDDLHRWMRWAEKRDDFTAKRHRILGSQECARVRYCDRGYQCAAALCIRRPRDAARGTDAFQREWAEPPGRGAPGFRFRGDTTRGKSTSRRKNRRPVLLRALQ